MSRGKLKNFFIYLFFLLVSFLIYIMVYLFPSLKTVNNIRIDVRDYQLKSRDLEKSKRDFMFPDGREKDLFRRVDDEFREMVPVFKNSEGRSEFPDDIGKELEKFFSENGFRNFSLKVKESNSGGKGINGGFDPARFIKDGEGVTGIHFTVSFSSSLRDLIEFLKSTVSFKGLLIVRGLTGNFDGNTYAVTLDMDILFRSGNTGKGRFSGRDFLDVNSPLLLKRVYMSGIERTGK